MENRRDRRSENWEQNQRTYNREGDYGEQRNYENYNRGTDYNQQRNYENYGGRDYDYNQRRNEGYGEADYNQGRGSYGDYAGSNYGSMREREEQVMVEANIPQAAIVITAPIMVQGMAAHLISTDGAMKAMAQLWAQEAEAMEIWAEITGTEAMAI